MLAGHYTGALVAKGLEPRLPLWLLFLAVQAVDIGWALLVMGGIERVSLDASLPSNPLVLEYMPYTHSLPATFVWAGAAFVLARTRFSRRSALLLAFAVASHWLGDLIVHRPDLGLWGDQAKVGFALWNWPLLSLSVEIVLVAGAAAFAFHAVKASGRSAWPSAAMAIFLIAVQLLMSSGAGPSDAPDGDPSGVVLGALAFFVSLAALAWAVERYAERSAVALGASQ